MKKALQITAILFMLCTALCELHSETIVVGDLRVEYIKNPAGIDVSRPRFSWKLVSDERGVSQTAYTIIVSTDKDF